jgi:capsular polysaccharide transport system permease protein
MGILILIHTVGGHGAPPYGDSTALFYATGLVPTLTFSYVSRFMGLSLLMNKPMLSFPEIHAIDVMLGRAFLEIVGASITLFLMTITLWVFGQNPFPIDLASAVSCYLATIVLAVGCGTLVGVLSLFFPIFATVYALIIIVLYISSGTLFVSSDLPTSVTDIISYNPLLICVEWMRTAFYESYSDILVSKSYVIAFGLTTLLLALYIERAFRRQLLESQ